MIRTVLRNDQWERIAPELPGKAGDPGATARDNRLFVEAVLWIARTGAPWRDLPEEFGNRLTVYTRFLALGTKGRVGALFQNPIGGSRSRIRPPRRDTHPGPPAWNRRKRGTRNQAIGKSRGGLTTKIAALVDALGWLTPMLRSGRPRWSCAVAGRFRPCQGGAYVRRS